MQHYDVLVLPTTPIKAMRKPVDSNLRTLLSTALGNVYNTAAFDVSGHPAMSVPCGLSQGLPVGFMVVGRHWDEKTVLRVGAACERRNP